MNITPIPIGEIVTAVNDPAYTDPLGLRYEDQQVTVVNSDFMLIDDPAAPLGQSYRYIYKVRAQDGQVLYCQRHELLRRGEREAAERWYAALIGRLTAAVKGGVQ